MSVNMHHNLLYKHKLMSFLYRLSNMHITVVIYNMSQNGPYKLRIIIINIVHVWQLSDNFEQQFD